MGATPPNPRSRLLQSAILAGDPGRRRRLRLEHDGPRDAGADAGDGGTSGNNPPCPGQCVPFQPDGWNFPDIAWFGKAAGAPSCPEALALGYQGYADLDAPLDCGACTCAPPAGSCALPSTITANAAPCAQNGASTPHTPFDPASGWAGACDTNDPIPSGKLCSGVHCVASVTVGPLAMSESGCAPSQPPPLSPPTWKTMGLTCRIDPYFTCPNAGDVCAPAPAPGFRVCIVNFARGDVDCPSFSAYAEKHVFYDAFDDMRSCSPCTCGAPAGSTCSASISIYTDGACSTLASSIAVDAAGPACADVISGSPLGSKSATPPAYVPGACAPGGGAPMGAATPTMPQTICCIPP